MAASLCAGAERLIVDAACEQSDLGHTVRRYSASPGCQFASCTGSVCHLKAHPPLQVHVYTAHHDPGHCFEETLSGDFTVVVAGGWFPRHVLHRAMALCAYIRCLLAALWLAWASFR
jgi:hypothetical protein